MKILEACFIKFDFAHEIFARELNIHDSEPHNGGTREKDVETLVEVVVVDRGAREDRLEAEEKHGEHEQHVFVEHVADQVCIPSIGLSAMKEKKLLQVFELADGVVACSGGLLALQA
jgi:hypothetical protein